MRCWFAFSLLFFGAATAVEFVCDNTPVDKTLNEGDVITVTYSTDRYDAGDIVIVTVESVVPQETFEQFSIQAQDSTGEVWGTWELSSMTMSTMCGNGYMLSSTQQVNVASFDVTWIAPAENMPADIQFAVTVMLNNNEYHTFLSTPPLIHEAYDPHAAPSEFEEPPMNPNMDEEPAPPQHEDGDGVVGNPGETNNGGEGLYGDMSHLADELDDNGGAAPSTDTPVVDQPTHTTVVDQPTHTPVVDQPTHTPAVDQPTDTPTVDLHDPASEISQAREDAEHRAQLIADEDANSEGNWTVQEEEERRQRVEEYDWELREQERIQYEEERKRQEIILWEIRDKEEHDAAVAAETPAPPREEPEQPQDDSIENEIDAFDEDTAGSSMVTATILTLLSAVLLTLA